MSRLPKSLTPSLKLFFQTSPSTVGNIRQFVSCSTAGSIQYVGKVNPNNLLLLNNNVKKGYGKTFIRTLTSSVKDGQESKDVKEKEFARNSEGPMGKFVKVNLRQKRMLVWSKKYPSVADVPEYVPESKMISATDIFRIKSNLVTILVFLFASWVTIKLGQNRRAKYIAQRQHEADEYNEMMDLIDAELDQAEENEKRYKAKQKK